MFDVNAPKTMPAASAIGVAPVFVMMSALAAQSMLFSVPPPCYRPSRAASVREARSSPKWSLR
jgi:hypothetical protein